MHAPFVSIPQSTTAVEVRLTGPELRRLARKSNATARAVLAEQLRSGVATLHHLTERQARTLAKASVAYVAAVHRATPDEWRDIVCGRIRLQKFAHQRRELTDADIDRFVAKLGADRVSAALDRYTAPKLPL